MPLWRGDNVEVRQLVEDFGRYLYLPRLRGPEVLTRAVQDGVALLSWETDSFALAESHDEAEGRYRGLQVGQSAGDSPESPVLLVKPEVARGQLDAEVPPTPVPSSGSKEPQPGTDPDGTEPPPPPPEKKARRFHGAVTLDSTRVGRDAGQIADEVISHLSGLVGSEVRVTLEIDAEIPDGGPGERRAHGHREQPYPEVRQPRIRGVVIGRNLLRGFRRFLLNNGFKFPGNRSCENPANRPRSWMCPDGIWCSPCGSIQKN